jgi:cell wall-associated NlpC family hydrolase
MTMRRFSRGAAVALAAAALVVLSGCSGSSPRFRSPESGAQQEPEEEIRFASKIREEETRGDDHKVDVGKATKGLSKSARAAGGTVERTPAGLNRDRVLLEVVSYLGVPYAYGEASKNGIDCSGYTSRVYRNAAGLTLPRSAKEQYREGKEIERDSLLFGDLVFFNTTGSGPSHVGIYLEDDLFAHASVSYGVTISSLQSTYYRTKYYGARRVAPD